MYMNIKIFCILSGVLLLLAIPSGWPYSYYIFLRWFISIVGLYVAYAFYDSQLQSWALVFLSIGLLFNPIIPIYLDKQSWVPIDLISAFLFFIASYSYRKK